MVNLKLMFRNKCQVKLRRGARFKQKMGYVKISATNIKLIKSPPTMWWRLIVLVLSIVIIIINKKFDDVNALQSPIFIRSLRIFF